MTEATDSYAEMEKSIVEVYYARGAYDAGRGLYETPFVLDEYDPDHEHELAVDSYRTGFFDKRKELGEEFRWA